MIDYGIITEAGAIQFQRLLPGPIERVWEYLTQSEKRGQWLATGAMELVPGGKVELRFRNVELSPYPEPTPEKYRAYEDVTMGGRIIRCEPPRLLVHSWEEEATGDSEVTFELEEQGEEVLLTLTHRRLCGRPAMIGVAGGWHTHLMVLKAVLNSKIPPPFWSTHAQLEAEYEGRIPTE